MPVCRGPTFDYRPWGPVRKTGERGPEFGGNARGRAEDSRRALSATRRLLLMSVGAGQLATRAASASPIWSVVRTLSPRSVRSAATASSTRAASAS